VTLLIYAVQQLQVPKREEISVFERATYLSQSMLSIILANEK